MLGFALRPVPLPCVPLLLLLLLLVNVLCVRACARIPFANPQVLDITCNNTFWALMRRGSGYVVRASKSTWIVLLTSPMFQTYAARCIDFSSRSLFP